MNKEFSAKSFEIFDKDWALLTAGKQGDYNTMTISWGGLGTIWHKPVVTVYVRPNRYTYKFMENSDYFTVSFYDNEYRKDLGILGSTSGRDGDKVAKTKLTPEYLENAVTFKQAKQTLICKKIYRQDLELDKIPAEARESFYQDGIVHRMYIGEVVDIL